MNCPRQEWEEVEARILSPRAQLSKNTSGRLKPEPECPLRTAFQHDRDRIIHSKSFRRLKHKTQVFLSPTGDHYRTRLTHTLEVAQIARTISRALRLNEDLTEAIALGHDLGHTPFGHAGENILDRVLPQGFCHYEQSLRVVDYLEREGQGLNLTTEVREGIQRHSKGRKEVLPLDTKELATTLEGQVVRIADIIGYVNHDIDDALRAGVISERDIPMPCHRALGETHSARINSMVTDIINASKSAAEMKLSMSPLILDATETLRDFLYTQVYENDIVHAEFLKAEKIIRELYEFFMSHEDFFHNRAGNDRQQDELSVQVGDFIAGMSDRYAMNLYEHLFMPQPWVIL